MTGQQIMIQLREYRQAQGLTQQALGELAGVRQATISGLESGRTRRVDMDVLARLCTALGVGPGDLLQRQSKRKTR